MLASTPATADANHHPDTSLRRGIDFRADTVEIYDLKGVYHKCERCSKYLPSVDKDLVFAMICDRCASVMHTYFYDVAQGHTHTMLPPNMVGISEAEFITKFVRREMQHLSFDGIQRRAEYIEMVRSKFGNSG